MAVYTEISSDILDDFLKQYDIGSKKSFSGIAEGIENSKFYLETSGGRFILTIFEKRVKPAELPYFMDLMTHLADNGFSCPLPVKGKDGAALRSLCGKTACLTTFLNGKSVTDIRPVHCAELGRAIALMQNAAKGFSAFRPNDLSVDGWAALIDKIGTRANEVENGLYDDLRRDFDFVAPRWPAHLLKSVIHADLFPDNVFFDGDRLSGVIDFYFACNDIAVYELAVCLNAWCFDASGLRFHADRAAAMLRAFDAVRPLSDDEKAAFPVLARGACLRFLLTRTYDWLNPVANALVTPKDPKQYVARAAFHRQVSTMTDYGF